MGSSINYVMHGESTERCTLLVFTLLLLFVYFLCTVSLLDLILKVSTKFFIENCHGLSDCSDNYSLLVTLVKDLRRIVHSVSFV